MAKQPQLEEMKYGDKEDKAAGQTSTLAGGSPEISLNEPEPSKIWRGQLSPRAMEKAAGRIQPASLFQTLQERAAGLGRFA